MKKNSPMRKCFEVVNVIRNAKSILLTSHERIDGDSIGAAIALIEAGKKINKEIYYFAPDELPTLYDFIPNISLLRRPIPNIEFDLAIVLDTSYKDRLGKARQTFESLPKIVIDHHEGEGDIEGIRLNDPSAASVTVLVLELLDELEIELDISIALPLYVGVFTDSWSFQQSNTDGRAMRCAARLIDAGAKPFDVATSFFESKPLSAIRLMGRAMERSKIEGNILWSYLLKSDFDELGAAEQDTEGIITSLRAASGIRVAILFRELDQNKIKVNFRSKDDTNVAEVARHFGGGGHRAAAGCTVDGTLDEVRKKVVHLFSAAK